MSIAVLIMRIVQYAFFIGLAGCALVVAFSWVSILKAALSKDQPNEK